MRNIASLLLAACLISPLASVAMTPDEAFVASIDAWRAKDARKLDALTPSLGEHPLAIYPQTWLLTLRLKDATADEARALLARANGSPLADQFRAEWLKQLASRADWATFDEELPNWRGEDLEVTCYALQSKVRSDATAARAARVHWFAGKAAPESCTPLFDRLVASGDISAADTWARIRLAFEAGSPGLAKATSRYLPAGESLKESQVDSAHSTPLKFLAGKLDLAHRPTREAALYALQRIARDNVQQAANALAGIAERLPTADVAYGWGLVAYRGAMAHDRNALSWYAAAKDASLNDIQLGWWARAALRAGAWPDVLTAVGRMSAEEQKLTPWRYWRGRALKATGKPEEAKAIFATLARDPQFYGLLAAEELGQVPARPHAAAKLTEADLAAVENNLGLHRAIALNRAGLYLEGVREWLAAIKSFDDKQLLASADMAKRNGWLERAINTADRTKDSHDFELRYPTPFREPLATQAETYQLDPAWLYGLIRQESRFTADIRSRAGAMGLMQLMPGTAQWVAKRLDWRGFRTSQSTDVPTNLALGSYYLRHVLDNLGHPVLATAAYNAGPNRAARWRATEPMEGAIYAESIPFTETRDYVRKVMANATLYSRELGQPWQPLKKRLGVIPGRDPLAPPVPDTGDPAGQAAAVGQAAPAIP